MGNRPVSGDVCLVLIPNAVGVRSALGSPDPGCNPRPGLGATAMCRSSLEDPQSRSDPAEMIGLQNAKHVSRLEVRLGAGYGEALSG
jgi:hypothetical protein